MIILLHLFKIWQRYSWKMLAFEKDQQVEEKFQSFEEGNDESNQVEYLKVKILNFKKGDKKVCTEFWYGKLKQGGD